MSSIVEEVLPTIRTHFSKLRVPHGHDKVYNDECVVSFDSPFSDNGIYINLISFYGYGADYYLADSKKTNNKLYLHSKWKQVLKEKEVLSKKEGEEQLPSKLAIGVEGGFSLEDRFDVIKTYSLVVIHNNTPCTIPLPNVDLPDMLIQVLDAVMSNKGMRTNLEKSSWEAGLEPLIISKYADALIQLDPNGKKISNNPKDWKCERSGDTENLWLNLSTGYIGGGRKNWDGSGGSGAALEHFNETGGLYPLCVKLGTITPHTADVFSYAPDEDDLVKDPKLGEHLAHWGIDIMKLEKTDKSMGEMEVEMNQNYNWSKIVEADSELLPMSGAGYVGLRNIGSSCYINTVLQTLLYLPEFKERYMGLQNERSAELFELCEGDPTMDLGLQLSKVATALLTDRYVPKAGAEDEWVMVDADDKNDAKKDAEAAGKKDQLEKYVVAPRMFKNVAARNNRDFLSGQQQDAGDFLLHFLEGIRQYEVANLNKVDNCNSGIPTNKLFEIIAEQRTQCSVTNEVRYKSDNSLAELMLNVSIPLDAAINASEVSEAQEKKKQKLANEGPNSVNIEDNVVPKVPFNACLETVFGAEEVEMGSPSLDGQNVPMMRTKKLTNFPRYLILRMMRYTQDSSWRIVKIDASIDVPEKLDLTAYKATGIQEGEVPMPDSNDDSNSTSNTTISPIEPDESVMAQLITMGFGENGCKRACIAGNNDVNAAMEWVFAHMGDADFNDPIVITDNSNGSGNGNGSASSNPPTELMENLQAMGATTDQAKAALLATDNDLARAADWFFSRDNLDAEVAAVLNGGSSSGTNTSAGASTERTPVETIDPNAQGTYSMLGIISHLGRSPDCGHYVCHVKKDGQWVLFNDEKVAQSKAPPLDQGFIYLFRRDDCPDTFTNTI